MRQELLDVPASRWLDKYFWNPFSLYVALGLVAFLISIAAFGIAKASHNDSVHSRVQFAKLTLSDKDNRSDFSADMVKQRKTVAYILLRASTMNDAIYGSEHFSAQKIGKLRKMMDDGQPTAVGDLHHWRFASLWNFYSNWIFLLVISSLFGFFFSFNYMLVSDYRDPRRMAELPWRKPWPWIITVLIGPIGAFFMLCSRLMLKAPARPARAAETQHRDHYPWYWTGAKILEYERQRLQEEIRRLEDDERRRRGEALHAVQRQREAQADRAAREARHQAALVDQAEQAKPAEVNDFPKYPSSPKVAEAVYTELRQGASLRNRRNRLTQVVAEISESRDCLKKLGAKIKETQTTIGQLQSEEQVLQAELASTTIPPVLGEEFARLKKLPGVIAVQVVDDRLRIIVRASVAYNGKKYDIGDFRMDIGADTTEFRAWCMRSGTKKRESDGYPVYRYIPRGDFCWGDRADEINRHLTKMQYLEAVALAVECLSSVNPEHQNRIPSTFKELAK